MPNESDLGDIRTTGAVGRSLRFSALFFCASALVLWFVFWLEIPVVADALAYPCLITYFLGGGLASLAGQNVPNTPIGFAVVVSFMWALLVLVLRLGYLAFLHRRATRRQRLGV